MSDDHRDNSSADEIANTEVVIYCPLNLTDSLICRLPGSGYLPIHTEYYIQVNEGQEAYLYRNGEVLDKFLPGKYGLTEDNIPKLISSLEQNHREGTPIDVQLFFVSSHELLMKKWGTPNAIMLNHPSSGTVLIRAYGAYSMTVTDPVKLIQVSTGFEGYIFEDFEAQLMYRIVRALSRSIIQSANAEGKTVSEILNKAQDLSQDILAEVIPQFQNFGLSVSNVEIFSLSLHDSSIEQLWALEQRKLAAQADVSERLFEFDDRLSRVEQASDEIVIDIRKSNIIARFSLAFLIFILGLSLIFAVPQLASWSWYTNHENHLGLNISAFLGLMGICWIIIDPDKKRRLFVLAGIILAALFSIIQLI